MSDEILDTAEGTAGDDLLTGRPSGPSKLLLIVFALAGAGAGGWFGGPLVTPMLAETLASSGSGGGPERSAYSLHRRRPTPTLTR